MKIMEMKKMLIGRCSCGDLIYNGDMFSKDNNKYKCQGCLVGGKKCM